MAWRPAKVMGYAVPTPVACVLVRGQVRGQVYLVCLVATMTETQKSTSNNDIV
jgi:hypothetical protein